MKKSPTRYWDLDDLVGVSDLAVIFDLNSSTVSQWQVRYEDFPAPLCLVSGRPVFSREQVLTWARERLWQGPYHLGRG